MTADQAACWRVSCSGFSIRKIEADERRPSRHLAERLAASLGIAEEERRDFLDAARAVRAANRLRLDATPVGTEARAADTLYHLGTVAWSTGLNDQAIGFRQQAVEICERTGFADLVAVQAYHGRGEAYFAIAEPNGLRELEAGARRWRGEALLAEKAYVEAQAELSRAAAMAEAVEKNLVSSGLEARLRMTRDSR